MKNDASLVSVIVPARNEEKWIEKCVRSLIRENYPFKEIIFVDDGSTDTTLNILENFKDKIKIIRTPGVGPSRARNMALRCSGGRYIAFTDADCEVDADWISELLKGFGDDDVWGVGGSQLVHPEESLFGRKVWDFFNAYSFVSDYVHSNSRIVRVRHNPTCNVIYRRRIFDRIGGFREDLWPCEDLEFDIRAASNGYVLVNNANARVYHRRPSSFSGFVRMMYRYGRAHSRLNLIHGFSELVHYIPLCFAVLIAINTLFAGRLWRIAAGFDLSVLICALSVGIYRTRSFLRGASSAFMLLTALLSWSFGFLSQEYRLKMGNNEGNSGQ